MARPLIECVPNISEGRDKAKIEAIARVAETVEGVRLLDVDPGATTNRTVITFVGEPEAVIEHIRLVKKAAELIDMRRIVASTRVWAPPMCVRLYPLPASPWKNCALRPQTGQAHRRGGHPRLLLRVCGHPTGPPNLAHCRKEYEGLTKLSEPGWEPDFGPQGSTHVPKALAPLR